MMTVPELVQLYAPLAGLLLMAFWVGVLSQRVRTLEKQAEALPSMATIAARVEGLSERMVELKTDNHAQFAELHHILRNRMMVKS